MKFTIVAAALLSLISAENCDPSKLSAEFYNDAACTQLDKEFTKNYGHVDPKDYKSWANKCNHAKGVNYSINCDGNGVHEKFYVDTECTKINKSFPSGGVFNFQWNTCEPTPAWQELEVSHCGLFPE